VLVVRRPSRPTTEKAHVAFLPIVSVVVPAVVLSPVGPVRRRRLTLLGGTEPSLTRVVDVVVEDAPAEVVGHG
jgi:hypothetical protein